MFGGPGWSRSIETDYEEEVGRILGDVPLAVSSGALELAGGKAKHMGVLVEVFRDRRRFLGVDLSSVYKLDRLKFIFRIAP